MKDQGSGSLGECSEFSIRYRYGYHCKVQFGWRPFSSQNILRQPLSQQPQDHQIEQIALQNNLAQFKVQICIFEKSWSRSRPNKLGSIIDTITQIKVYKSTIIVPKTFPT